MFWRAISRATAGLHTKKPNDRRQARTGIARGPSCFCRVLPLANSKKDEGHSFFPNVWTTTFLEDGVPFSAIDSVARWRYKSTGKEKAVQDCGAYQNGERGGSGDGSKLL